jgi:hypothetical protein
MSSFKKTYIEYAERIGSFFKTGKGGYGERYMFLGIRVQVV